MSSGSTFKVKVVVPKHVVLEGSSRSMNRSEFFEWVWAQFTDSGLIGVHEGTLLSEEAFEQGIETESWTVDSGEAPRERDWIESQEESLAELFFADLKSAEAAALVLRKIPALKVDQIEEQVPQDWDAEWKASFLNSGAGIDIPPFWKVVPAWFQVPPKASEKLIRINPGAGFGTGTHETTQLCLEAIGMTCERLGFYPRKALDFGSGSGILSVALASLGISVTGVEIDPLAIENAGENASLNQVEDRIRFVTNLPAEGESYPLIVANILRPVLLEFSEALVNRLERGGTLILSGLIEKDVEWILQEYQKRFGLSVQKLMEKAEWRALILEKS